MRILYLTPTNCFSGGERVTLNIASAMKERGHVTTYVGLEGPIRQFCTAAGIDFYPLPQFSPRHVKAVVRAVRPDLLHCMDYRASTYAALTGTPFIAHLHSNPPWLHQLCPNSLAMLFLGKRAEHIIVVSSSVMDEYLFAKQLVRKTTVLGNTVDIQAVRHDATVPPAPMQNYELGFIGRMSEEKGPQTFVRIVEAVRREKPNARALMLGAGEQWGMVDTMIKSKHLSDVIDAPGFLSNPFALLNRCQVMVMPSLYEGFGLTAVEGMALGKPVLASPVGGLRDIVTDDCGALCDDVDDFAAHALNLLDSPALYAQKSAAALRRAEQYSDRTGYFNAIEKIYVTCF